jgi:hypothetical protein
MQPQVLSGFTSRDAKRGIVARAHAELQAKVNPATLYAFSRSNKNQAKTSN